MSEKTAKLEIDGKVYELPIIVGTENEVAIDIRKLRGESKIITLDNGYMNTGSCESKITFLNGEEGILRYRGYPIEQLAENSNFMEVAYLLNYGKLPTSPEFEHFYKSVESFSEVPKGIQKIIDQFPKGSHPMGVISAATNSLSAFYPEFLETPLSPVSRERAIAQLLGQVKNIVSYFYRCSVGKDLVRSNPDLGFSGDFLNMMFQDGHNSVDPEVAHALDVLFILHADHEQNCSASTVRMVGSSQANIFATIAAGIDALWGQLHGGANQRVLEMLEEIKNDGGDYKKFINKAKDKNDPFRLFGFGHRVYKNFDPRALLIKKQCDIVLEKMKIDDPLLDIAKGLEEQALNDDYFKARNLYPNVDFYSGIIYKALGIPTDMFTVMFVMGRLPGWLAQWKEMREDISAKISRPRQIYTGDRMRDYIAMKDRQG
jgi:citrate synthase